jgi:hypothetical protein
MLDSLFHVSGYERQPVVDNAFFTYLSDAGSWRAGHEVPAAQVLVRPATPRASSVESSATIAATCWMVTSTSLSYVWRAREDNVKFSGESDRYRSRRPAVRLSPERRSVRVPSGRRVASDTAYHLRRLSGCG